MAEKPDLIHVDDDWKKQAAEEKRRLAEQEKLSQAPPGPAGAVSATGGAPAAGAGAARGLREHVASFAALVRSLYTDFLFSIGRLTLRGVPPSVDLDRAKFQLDLLAVLEQKTAGNLTPEEAAMLDAILLDARTNFVSVASEYAELP